jgi:hypothetical protein
MFECTFCADCMENILAEVCPNCGGNYTSRPIQPGILMDKNPVSKKNL